MEIITGGLFKPPDSKTSSQICNDDAPLSDRCRKDEWAAAPREYHNLMPKIGAQREKACRAGGHVGPVKAVGPVKTQTHPTSSGYSLHSTARASCRDGSQGWASGRRMGAISARGMPNIGRIEGTACPEVSLLGLFGPIRNSASERDTGVGYCCWGGGG